MNKIHLSGANKRIALAGLGVIATLALSVEAVRWMSTTSHASVKSDATEHAIVLREGDKYIVPPDSALRSRLSVAAVGLRDEPRMVQLPATVEADPARTANILPPVAGRIVELKVHLGDHVTKGQPLLTIDSGDLAQAWSDNDKARDAFTHAGTTLKRVQGLRDAGAGAAKDLEQAQSDYTQAQAELTRSETRLRGIGADAHTRGRQLTLVAPYSGTITALSTSQGGYANDLTASLMTVSNLDSVWVTANAPESNVALIAKDQPVDVVFQAYPGQTWHGKVSFVSEVLDPDTRRAKVRIAFPNTDGRLKPNMFATATFAVPQQRSVFVPNSALIMNNDSTVVWVEVAPWTFVKRTVQPGYGEPDGARVGAGLTVGDRIVVKGGVLLND
ncbi:Cobalt-zinc-cadmium resistance protein CzcB [Pandoraea iniqua]|uniref:Cobalt-zinc-cadmium resistance protein CzcB n=1 Tax=Pandoraea iniqua TaxID=2508288 RepID=A0A5E4U639_9BURK|nr:efflux RND transporter periplasmic adaptor subunit [Pandoraea iniqua]VVD93649.1 Cobalt-zinc-cadmium resistance protein CzcB [Pandoraea iniqua]VVD97865.1 Cobalt-zinc-cadmium resistance protein CzcB [Pandoraea iniqua]